VTDQLKPESSAENRPHAKAEVRAAEAAAIRRRWITLGEVLAVLAVIISALTLWNNWSERHASDAVKNADAAKASARAGTLLLVAINSGKSELVLKPGSAEQSVQSQQISFPRPWASRLPKPPASRALRPPGSKAR
jgi:predicted xylose isomerase-like sugar epimerase